MTSYGTGRPRRGVPHGLVLAVVVLLLAVTATSGQAAGRGTSPLPLAFWPTVHAVSDTAIDTVTRGVDLSGETLATDTGARQEWSLSIDLTDPNVRLAAVAARDRVAGGPETLSSMADRTGAVAGVNGDFFRIRTDSSPINMEEIGGRLLQSQDPTGPSYAVFGITADGTPVIADEQFTATISDGAASRSLASVNSLPALARGVVLLTPDLGHPVDVSNAVVVTLAAHGGVYVATRVAHVKHGVVPVLAAGQRVLIGVLGPGRWLSSSIRAGDSVTVASTTSPDNDLRDAIGGGPILVREGHNYLPAGDISVPEAKTAVAISQDGRHLWLVCFQGGEFGSGQGLKRDQLSSWLVAHGAWTAMMFDDGGSAEMVARPPGATTVTPVNAPSDGHERPLANGLFVYATTPPGPAATVVIPTPTIALLTGTGRNVSPYALDAQANPAATPISLSTGPLASVKGSRIIAGSRPGTTALVARSGTASAAPAVTIFSAPQSLSVTAAATLRRGQQTAVRVTALDPSAAPLPLPRSGVTYSVSPAGLGSVDRGGVFHAARRERGKVHITVSLRGVTASTVVTVT